MVLEVGDEGRLEIVSPFETSRDASAAEDLRAGCPGSFDKSLDSLTLDAGDQGAHLDIAVERRTDLALPHLLDEGLLGFFQSVLVYVHPRRRGAVLPGVERRCQGYLFGRGFDVGVVEDDDRRFAA